MSRPNSTGVWVLVAAILGSGLAFIDSSAVNVALPVMGHDLHADAASLQWVVESYALSLSALILIGGALGDRFGRRRIFVYGNALFAAASLACGFAPNAEWLIVARFVQGIGGALATPGSLALISANFDGQARGKAIGTWSGFSAMTSAVGPLLGGGLAQTVGWRWVFFANVPLALAVCVISLCCVPESDDPQDRGPVDYLGSLLATAGLGALTFGLIRLQGAPGEPLAIGVSAGGLLLLAGFAGYERIAPQPMMPLDVFKNRAFSGANLYTLFLYAALGGSLFFVPFYLQNVQGYTPVAAGGALLPFIAIMFSLSRWSGGLVATIGARTPMVLGALVEASGFVAFAFAASDRPYWVSVFPAACLLGAGGALFVAPLTTLVMDSVSGDRSGVASGINNAVSRVAGLLAIAGIGIILIGSFYRNLDRDVARLHVSPATAAALAAERGQLPQQVVPARVVSAERAKVRMILREAYTDGFRAAMFSSALLCAVAGILALLTIPAKKRA